MAAVTAAVITAGAAAASAHSSYKAGKEQERQNRAANARIAAGQMQNFGFGQEGGTGTWGSYDPGTGKTEYGLGEALTTRLGQTSAFGDQFVNAMNRDWTGGLSDIMGQQRGQIGNQPWVNQNLFAGLQGQTQANLGMAQAGIGRAGAIQGQLDPFAQDAFGFARQQMGDVGTAEQVRGDVLGLLRQQAQPFEERAFTGLMDKQYAQGRLGTSGGALQTEAFARGLAQADTSRQLQSFAEGRARQANSMNLAQGFSGLGTGALNLGDSLVGNAFRNFGNFANLAQDIDRTRFGQEQYQQANVFNQLNSLFGNEARTLGLQNQFSQQNFQNFLSALGAEQGINQIPIDQLMQFSNIEAQRSNQAVGSGTGLQPVGQGYSGRAAAFSGLGQAAQSLGDIFTNIGQPANTTNYNYMPQASQTNQSMWGPNPFAGMFPEMMGGGGG